MTKSKLTIAIIFCLTLVIVLTGCGVSFPKTAEKLLENSAKVWTESARSIVDTYKISSATFSIPTEITGIGSKTLTVDIKGGEVVCVRKFNDDTLEIDLSFANFVIVADNQLRAILNENGINLDKSAQVNGTVNLKIDHTAIKAVITVNNLNLISSKCPPISTTEEVFSSAEHGDLLGKINSFGKQTVFGTIAADGKLDKVTNSYSYTLTKDKVHDELLKLPKLLVDLLGNKKFDGSTETINAILKKYFSTQNIVNIANSCLLTKDMKIMATLDKTNKLYYISKLSGNYIGHGAISREITQQIFEDVIRRLEGGDELLNMVTLTGGISITANIAISSTIKLK